MRKAMLPASVLVCLFASVCARAQQSLASNPYFFGANPANLTFTPVDISKAMQPMNLTGTSFYRTPMPQSGIPGFSANRLYPTINLGSWPPVLPKAPDFSKFFKKS